MVDRDVFGRRLARLESSLTDLRTLATIDRGRYLADRGLQAQAERWLQLAAEIALDLAHHAIADRGWRTPTTYREVFLVLRDAGVLDAELAESMAGWAGLRNILVHACLDVDQNRLHEILTTELEQLERFAVAVGGLASDESRDGREG